jgi:DNA repair exonuclease SbcCD ATPase subunit
VSLSGGAEMNGHSMVARLAALESALATRDAELARRDAELAKARKERDFLRAAYDALKQELELLKRRMFIATAERVDSEQLKLEFQDKLALLNKMACTLEEPKGEEPVSGEPVKGGKRDGRKKRKTSPTGRRKLDELDEATLPVVRVPVTDPVFEQLVARGRPSASGSRRARGSATNEAASGAS